jgi:hypothetical protein
MLDCACVCLRVWMCVSDHLCRSVKFTRTKIAAQYSTPCHLENKYVTNSLFQQRKEGIK